jgi:zinc protease
MQEATDKPGVASFVASLLNQGTATKSAEAIADLVESAGGIVGVGSGNELSFISGAVVKDQVDLMLGLASEMVQRPAFSPEEIDRQRRQTLSALQVSYDDPDYIADLVFDRLVFGFHPYGRPNQGTPESIARITRDDLVNFHKTWFVPNNALLAIVGDLTADEAMAAAEKAFGSWARKDVPLVKPVDPPAPRGASSSWIGRVRRRPKSASAISRFHARIPTICRSRSPRASWAARAPTVCSVCCAATAG